MKNDFCEKKENKEKRKKWKSETLLLIVRKLKKINEIWKMWKKNPLEKKNKTQSNPLFQWVGYGFTHFPMGLKVPTHTDIFY